MAKKWYIIDTDGRRSELPNDTNNVQMNTETSQIRVFDDKDNLIGAFSALFAAGFVRLDDEELELPQEEKKGYDARRHANRYP